MSLEFAEMLKVMAHFGCFGASQEGGAREAADTAAADTAATPPSRGARGAGSSSSGAAWSRNAGGPGGADAAEGQRDAAEGQALAQAPRPRPPSSSALASEARASFVGAAAGAEPLDVVIKLGLDYSAAGKEGSAHRMAFVNNLTQDLGNATGQPAGMFEVTRVSPGSVMVDVLIHGDGAGGGEARATPL